jgi:hypothetical protein
MSPGGTGWGGSLRQGVLSCLHENAILCVPAARRQHCPLCLTILHFACGVCVVFLCIRPNKGTASAAKESMGDPTTIMGSYLELSSANASDPADICMEALSSVPRGLPGPSQPCALHCAYIVHGRPGSAGFIACIGYKIGYDARGRCGLGWGEGGVHSWTEARGMPWATHSFSGDQRRVNLLVGPGKSGDTRGTGCWGGEDWPHT